MKPDTRQAPDAYMETDEAKIAEITASLPKGKTLFVSDLDGTLMQPDATISPYSLRILNDAIADGALFTIATARTTATVAPIVKDLDLRIPAIVMTGAALWDKASNSYSDLKFMKEDAVRCLIDVCRKNGMPMFVYTVVGNMLYVYHTGKLTRLEQEFIDSRANNPHKKFIVPPDGESFIPEKLDNVILFYDMQPTELTERTYDEAALVPNCRVQMYHDFYGPSTGLFDAFAPEVTKASAIRALADRIGAEKIVAFGDNINDLPMLRAADVAVAVGNALPEVKAEADIVIGPNTDDSVARFIQSTISRQ